MEPRRRRRVPARHGHLSSTCAGESASSLQTRQRELGNPRRCSQRRCRLAGVRCGAERLRSSPVTGAQLVDVHCGVTVVAWDGRRCSVTHDGLEEARWPATPPLSDGSPPDRSDQRPEVGRDVLLREGRDLSCQSVSTFVARQATVGRYSL